MWSRTLLSGKFMCRVAAYNCRKILPALAWLWYVCMHMYCCVQCCESCGIPKDGWVSYGNWVSPVCITTICSLNLLLLWIKCACSQCVSISCVLLLCVWNCVCSLSAYALLCVTDYCHIWTKLLYIWYLLYVTLVSVTFADWKHTSRIISPNKQGHCSHSQSTFKCNV